MPRCREPFVISSSFVGEVETGISSKDVVLDVPFGEALVLVSQCVETVRQNYSYNGAILQAGPEDTSTFSQDVVLFETEENSIRLYTE